MQYDFIKIGNRITDLREKKKWTQTDLINQLEKKGYSVGRNTISNLENGKFTKDNFNLKFLLTLCELFDCESGYLLGEYDFHSKNEEIINKEVGLSAQSIQYLKANKEKSISRDEENSQFWGGYVEKRNICEKEQYIYTLNYLLEKYPSIISDIGRILLHDEIGLSNGGCILKDDSKEGAPYTAVIRDDLISLSIKLENIYLDNEEPQRRNISLDKIFEFVSSLIGRKLEYQEHLIDGLSKDNEQLKEKLHIINATRRENNGS